MSDTRIHAFDFYARISPIHFEITAERICEFFTHFRQRDTILRPPWTSKGRLDRIEIELKHVGEHRLFVLQIVEKALTFGIFRDQRISMISMRSAAENSAPNR